MRSNTDRPLNDAGPGAEGLGGECPANDALLAYFDGMLDEEKDAEIRWHLAFCKVCPELILALKRLADVEEKQELHARESPLTAGEFIQRLESSRSPLSAWRRRIQRVFTRGRPDRRVYVPVGAASILAALALVAGLGFYPSELSRLAYVNKDNAMISELRSAAGAKGNSPKELYHRGLESLLQSQCWTFNRVNEAKLEESIRDLQAAKRLAKKTEYAEGYVAGCCFYLGKAYLKKKDIIQARKYFEEFRTFSELSAFLSRQKEAEQIIKAIDQIERSRK